MSDSQLDLLVYGAGGHGRVVAEAAQAAGWRVVGFLDDAIPVGSAVGRWYVVHEGMHPQVAAIVAVGDNAARSQLQQRCAAAGRDSASVVHPTACVSPSAAIGRGVFVGPRAVVNADAQLADGVIVNSGAIVEHGCRVGPFAHIAPGAALGGGVQVGARALVGLGAAVHPGLRIGAEAIVGVGAAVVADVGASVTVVGVPARVRPGEQ